MACAFAGPILGNSSSSAAGAEFRSIGYRSTASPAAGSPAGSGAVGAGAAAESGDAVGSAAASSGAAGEATSPALPSGSRAPPGNEPTTMPSATNRRTLRSSRVTGAVLPGVRVHFLRDIGGPFVRLDPA